MANTHQHFKDFLQYLQFQKRYSRNTIISYTTDLLAYEQFLQQNFEVQDPALGKAPFIRTWLASLKNNELTARTINRKISSLRSFYKFLLRNKVISASPMAGISTPKNAKRLPQFVAEKDMALLFTHVEFTDDFKGATERMILEILYNAGLRQAELISLKMHGIDFSGKVIRVLGKGNKERVIPVSAGLIANMKNYLQLRAQVDGATLCPTFLCTHKGRTLYPRYVYDVVKKYLSLVTTIEKRSPHILRHSFATHLTNNGADINAIKDLMGHSSLAATQVYTHNSIEKLKDAYKKAHPKA